MDLLTIFLQRFFGAYTAVDWLTYIGFLIIGITISVGFKSRTRDKLSPNTPYKFNLKFFIIDNFPRVLSSLLACFVVIRFSSSLGFVFIDVYAIVLGLLFDQFRDIYTEVKESYRDKIRKFFTK